MNSKSVHIFIFYSFLLLLLGTVFNEYGQILDGQQPTINAKLKKTAISQVKYI
jgi:hypothetical protein